MSDYQLKIADDCNISTGNLKNYLLTSLTKKILLHLIVRLKIKQKCTV